MLRIKRLYTFVLGTFLPLMLATYSVCLFIILMQFLWQFVNDMVGKGVGMNVLAEMFFYAALSFTPMALPLAVLLASLMTFGNLGEHLELLAMKASGISLLRIMKPLILFAILMAGVSFLFQNDIAPRAQTKMYTIVVSLRRASPELDIPEGSFYNGIPGYNVYVRQKDKNGMLHGMMIYDYSGGFDNLVVIVADSGRLSESADKKHLVVTLYNGKSFRNWGESRSRNTNEGTPYLRETFRLRHILKEHDSNFTMADESIIGGSNIGKNMRELTTYIDSVRHEQDSVYKQTAPIFKNSVYTSTFSNYSTYRPSRVSVPPDSLFGTGFGTKSDAGIETAFNHLPAEEKIVHLQQAKRRTEQIQSDYDFTKDRQVGVEKQVLLHVSEYYKRLSMAFSCILFFFIGAPLGAIIRKGGLGMPAVISVLLYLTYYTVDVFGIKMVQQAVLPPLQGASLSTVLLLGLGVFFTYKAVNDSTMIDADSWKVFFRKLSGKRELRNYTRKELIMTSPDYCRDIETLNLWNERSENYLRERKKLPLYGTFWRNRLSDPELKFLVEDLENTIDDLLNSEENLIICKLMDYPVMQPLNLNRMEKPAIRLSCAIVFPVGLIIYGVVLWKQNQINNDLISIRKVNEGLITELEKLV